MKIYHPFYKWEDYQNGMYETRCEETYIQKAKELLKSKKSFAKYCDLVILHWRHATEENLTATGNKKSWMGWAACSYAHKCTETETRQAWKLLNSHEQYEANKIAETKIKQYARQNRKLHPIVGAKMLPPGYTRGSSTENQPIKQSPFIQGDMFGDFK